MGILLLGLNLVGKVRIELALESYYRIVILLSNILIGIGVTGLIYRVSTGTGLGLGECKRAYINLRSLL